MAHAVDLSEKTAVVTGAGRGLGLAYARALAEHGAAVVVNDVDAEAADAAAKLVRDAGGRAVAVPGPVGPTETAEALVAAAVEQFGGIDVMVTNAGVLRDTVLWKMSDDDFDTVVDVHLRGTFTCVRAAAIAMRAAGKGGRIIVAGSPTGQRGTFGQTNYAAAKAGIVGMMRTWAMELARAEITVNALIPVAATAMTKTIPFFAPHVQALERDGVPLPDALRKGEGFGTVEDVAGLVVYLASDASAHVSGQAIGIGGDKLALWSHPQEVAVEYADGGWSAEAIAQAWPSTLGAEPETVGIPAWNGGRVSAQGLDVESLIAIDVHTHAEVSNSGSGSLSTELEEASSKYFKVDGEHRKPTLDEIGAYYRSLNMAAVVFTVDAEAATGVPAVPNEEIAEAARRYPDAIIPFASIDPAKGRAGARRVRELVEQQGVRGFKFHPNLQAFYPNDREAYPLYEAIEECGAIAVFHTGQTGIGAGAPGGGGIRLKYSNPMLVDDVAADFPGMPIILAHPSFPWQDEALAVATHKPQVYIDLSGWSPKYFPPQLVQYANSLLQDKVLFGTDYPLLTPERWLADFEKLPIKDTVRPKILKGNAARLLGL